VSADLPLTRGFLGTETFGFCLHEELCCQGHVIRQLELGGVAQRRGLQDGDRLLQVNGHFVDHMDHLRVVQKIKASGNQVLLAVLDGDSYEAAKSLGRDLSQMLPGDIRPRLCHVTRDKSGFGFSVSCTKGTFQLSVLQDGPADRAGVPAGDRVLAVNGESIEGLDHEQTVHRIRAREDQVTLLVIDPAGDEFYHSVGFGGTVLRSLWGPLVTGDRQEDPSNLCPRRASARSSTQSCARHSDSPALDGLSHTAPPVRPLGLSTAQHGPCTRSSCVSMPGSQHDTPRDSSLLTEAGSELLSATVAAPPNLTTELCLCLPSYLQAFLRTLH
uniref:NHERF family PDZ scaffold protein 4 n=1 Tax=Taeniopygia guttata TaxID=59729 RepID=A0A674HEP8_TAEGU